MRVNKKDPSDTLTKLFKTRLGVSTLCFLQNMFCSFGCAIVVFAMFGLRLLFWNCVVVNVVFANVALHISCVTNLVLQVVAC